MPAPAIFPWESLTSDRLARPETATPVCSCFFFFSTLISLRVFIFGPPRRFQFDGILFFSSGTGTGQSLTAVARVSQGSILHGAWWTKVPSPQESGAERLSAVQQPPTCHVCANDSRDGTINRDASPFEEARLILLDARLQGRLFHWTANDVWPILFGTHALFVLHTTHCTSSSGDFQVLRPRSVAGVVPER